jgi:hypothetical protein
VTTVLLLVRERFLPGEKPYWHEENDLLRW